MTAGIVCDNWKLPVFERRLNESNFVYMKSAFTKDTTTLSVEFVSEQFEQLSKLVVAAQSECAELKAKNN